MRSGVLRGIYGLFAAASLLAGVLSARSQEPAPAEPAPATDPDEETGPEPTYAYWRAEFSSGRYTVELDKVASVSLQEYILDGTQAVSEVTVGTTGSEVARFYYMAPIATPSRTGIGADVLASMTSEAERLSEKKVPDSTATTPPVVKTYPLTTHAHVVEYRLGSRDMLLKLYDSLEKSWTKRKSTLFRPGSVKE